MVLPPRHLIAHPQQERRHFTDRPGRWDDWFIVISFAVSTGVTAGAEISEFTTSYGIKEASTDDMLYSGGVRAGTRYLDARLDTSDYRHDRKYRSCPLKSRQHDWPAGPRDGSCTDPTLCSFSMSLNSHTLSSLH